MKKTVSFTLRRQKVLVIAFRDIDHEFLSAFGQIPDERRRGTAVNGEG